MRKAQRILAAEVTEKLASWSIGKKKLIVLLINQKDYEPLEKAT